MQGLWVMFSHFTELDLVWSGNQYDERQVLFLSSHAFHSGGVGIVICFSNNKILENTKLSHYCWKSFNLLIFSFFFKQRFMVYIFFLFTWFYNYHLPSVAEKGSDKPENACLCLWYETNLGKIKMLVNSWKKMLLIYNELQLLNSALGLFLPSKELNSLGIHPGSQNSKIILHKVFNHLY